MAEQPESHVFEQALARWYADLNHQGIVATDDQLRVTTWNRWMEVHSGVPRERGLDEYYERARAGEVSIISHGLHRYVLPLKPTNSDVRLPYMPQSARIGPLWDDSRVIGTVTLVDDVSDRLASETELRRQIEAQKVAREAAERALRAKDDFLSTLSHELRQPLNAVLGWTRMLRDRTNADPALQTRALEIIDRNATVQARMIDDLLDMARIVTGKLRLDLQRLDLAPVASAAVDVVTPTARAKGITITTRIRDDVPPVLGDPARLQQVVWNLLSNAVKFTDAGGTIELRLEARSAGVELQVADTGRGIRPEFLPFLFHRFSQGDASSTRREGGLGLGLALVRELVELHGGTVDAASDGEGTGATFTVHLPAMITPDPRRDAGDEG